MHLRASCCHSAWSTCRYSTLVPASAVAVGCTLSADVGAVPGEYFVANSILYASADGVEIPVNATAGPSAMASHVVAAGPADSQGLAAPRNTTLFILSNAMGLANVDPQPSDGKGLVGRVVLTCGHASALATTVDITNQAWTMAWPLAGETMQIYTAAGTDAVPWQPLASLPDPAAARQVWFRFHLDLPSVLGNAHRDDQQQATQLQTAFVLDLTGMTKGVAYVNGFSIGRYWLIVSGALSSCKEGQCALNFPGPVCYFHKKDCGRPTQHLYHVPTGLLKERGNLVVLFEESGGVRASDTSEVALVVLHEHPHVNR